MHDTPQTPGGFTSTGPHGHRGRMRARVLASGAASLADYELLEMLLFHGIPRRDTKPMAKALLQQFGTLIGVFRAPGKALRGMGLTDEAIRVLRFPAIAAERLAGAELRARPALGNWAQLLAYLDIAMRGAQPGQMRMFYVDNRNRLLADEPFEAHDGAATALRRALGLHATGLIGFLRLDGDNTMHDGRNYAPAMRMLEEAARPLAVMLHDVVAIGAGDPVSFRQEGWL
ncbi:JAB domain-containing protein [Brytella acorum]|uniref:DNA repair protein RadC n=1 Tax=Brytella acorum TaxID=2959299 RepID=A0AA35V8K2_9PROT|nr:JAB domain-containing protein [Brytella acorum]MDF3624376.1 JAB domain-containing protein [Brytella acorum]CAI9119774.1 DNA repair protein RadC [Brytella acorum]